MWRGGENASDDCGDGHCLPQCFGTFHPYLAQGRKLEIDRSHPDDDNGDGDGDRHCLNY